MKTWVITCTGDRPRALNLCNHYMNRQTHKDFTWIVVDDGAEESPRPSRANIVRKRTPTPGKTTLVDNLRAGLEDILKEGNPEKDFGMLDGIVLIVEDDDWYHPAYIGLMQNLASNLPPETLLFGESHTRYYNVRWRTYRHNDNDKHASLCSMGFFVGFIPSLLKIMDEADPERPFIDVTAFEKYHQIAHLSPTDLVCGIKGMPGRKGIGHGHTEPCKRLKRDPYMDKLVEWIGEDAQRYKDFYFHEEMKEIPIRPDQRGEPWVVQFERENGEGGAGICGFFRQVSILPDLGAWGAGVFAHGYQNDIREITDARLGHFPKFDMVVISGGLLRHGGLNGVVHHHYRSLGVPVIICDPGRIVKGTQRIYVNHEGWLPPIECSRDRLELLGLEYKPKPRGEKILIAGQRAELDNQLAAAVDSFRDYSAREIVFRPHPNMYNPHQREEYDLSYDTLSADCDKIDSKSIQSLNDDLDDAWCVVTHSSIVGVTALLRGIPVFCSDDAVFSEPGLPLDFALCVDDTERPGWGEIQNFMRKWSYTVWFETELRSGKAFAFLKQFIKKEEPCNS